MSADPNVRAGFMLMPESGCSNVMYVHTSNPALMLVKRPWVSRFCYLPSDRACLETVEYDRKIELIAEGHLDYDVIRSGSSSFTAIGNPCSNPAEACESSARARCIAPSASTHVQARTEGSRSTMRVRQSVSSATAVISRVASFRAASVALS